MKKKSLWCVALMVIAMVCCVLYACREDEPLPVPIPPEPEDSTAVVGDISFTIEDVSSGVTLSDDTPVVVETGDTLDVVVSQTSAYTDPDGSVFKCQPKAAIKLFAHSDTLYVKNFQTLTTVKEIANETTQETKGELEQYLRTQTFDVGGQTITFDLSHEIYRHVNSARQAIEMPYIKLNPAQYGVANAEEKEANAPAKLTGIRLVPKVPQTRGVVLTDSVLYDVTVLFNIDMESIHTKDEDTHNVPFEVRFAAVVENTTELPDPTMEFLYTEEVISGSQSTQSPYEVISPEQLLIRWQQDTKYTYFSIADRVSHELRYEPKAEMMIIPAKDTVFVGSKDDIDMVNVLPIETSSEGENPTVHNGSQVLELGGEQIIRLNWSHDAYDAIEIEGNTVPLPYIALSDPEFLGVTLKAKPEDSTYGVNATVYEVSVMFKQEVYTQNTAENTQKTVEYIVKYIAVEQIKLVKVTYRKGWKWEPAHDNIIFGYYACVYRDRTYSNGETVTDTYWDYGHFRHMCPNVGTLEPMEYEWDGKKITYSAENQYNNDSTIFTCWRSISVPDLSKLRIWGLVFSHYVNEPPGTWSVYKVSRLGNPAKIPLDNVEICGADSISDLPSGFYFWGPEYHAAYVVYYIENDIYYPLPSHVFLRLEIVLRMPDQFMVIDGQMITFLEFRGEPVVTSKEEDITMPNGAPGKVFTLEGRQHFLGKDFYVAAIDTVYQQQP